ncbi:Uncharacterised protein [Chlamydia trachomatis]|nr:Uncharacterised protein [Chlamydia trachomatis]
MYSSPNRHQPQLRKMIKKYVSQGMILSARHDGKLTQACRMGRLLDKKKIRARALIFLRYKILGTIYQFTPTTIYSIFNNTKKGDLLLEIVFYLSLQKFVLK